MPLAMELNFEQLHICGSCVHKSTDGMTRWFRKETRQGSARLQTLFVWLCSECTRFGVIYHQTKLLVWLVLKRDLQTGSQAVPLYLTTLAFRSFLTCLWALCKVYSVQWTSSSHTCDQTEISTHLFSTRQDLFRRRLCILGVIRGDRMLLLLGANKITYRYSWCDFLSHAVVCIMATCCWCWRCTYFAIESSNVDDYSF